MTTSSTTVRHLADATVYFLNLIDDRGCLVSTEHAFVTPAPGTKGNAIRPASGMIHPPNVS
ncbi:MAG: hypothetical protein RLZZ214_582 [Verrucomicrobiota bacterium]|jgi:hypothetical protein